MLVLLLAFTVPVNAQFSTKTLEFPEYGFKIPFFSDATRTVHNPGTESEQIEYRFEYSGNGNLFAFLRIFPRVGCLSADSLYSQSERYVKQNPEKPFRMLHATGNTYPFGWTGYFASAVIDDTRGSHLATREVQTFLNGRVLFMVDIISQGTSFADETRPILEEPGYNSILLPHDLTGLNLRLYSRGHVVSRYEPTEKKYYLGRCDKLGTTYPHATLERLEADPASTALNALANARQTAGISGAALEELPNTNRLNRLTGTTYRLSYNLESAGIAGQRVHYFFTFQGRHYLATLTVPFMADDNRVYWYQDNAINEESVVLFEDRLLDMLGTLEKIP